MVNIRKGSRTIPLTEQTPINDRWYHSTCSQGSMQSAERTQPQARPTVIDGNAKRKSPPALSSGTCVFSITWSGEEQPFPKEDCKACTGLS